MGRLSMWVLLWSSLVLVFTMTLCGIAMNRVLASFMLDASSVDIKQRREMFLYFGSFTRSLLTMQEITLGNHVPVMRLLVEHAGEGWMYLFMIYKLIVGFGLVTVIRAVFMHETFRVAATDNELMIMQKTRMIEKHKEQMTLLFKGADASGDGNLSFDEFMTIVRDPFVKMWLSAMELSTDDVQLLFRLIGGDDMRISPEELIKGTARLKGAARSIDMFIVMEQYGIIKDLMDGIQCSLMALPKEELTTADEEFIVEL